jgi:multiple sugar transport system substrate-binding protein
VWAYYERINNGNTPVSVADYLRSIQPRAQSLLNEAIADERALNPNR